MRLLNRTLGCLVALIGLGLAGWAPPAFEVLSGRVLPTPVASDQVAMTVWSGVAFVRVFGAILFGAGAVCWASNAQIPKTRVIQASLFVSFVLAGLIVSAQQVAIWANAVGWVLAGLFCALAAATGIPLVRPGRRATSNAAA
ncbi:MAG TPA: hypothetical protein VEL51_18390 [Vicinamibacterales bacterium]|nr:hypothetical protein [Vicinamibacterales bacterium]